MLYGPHNEVGFLLSVYLVYRIKCNGEIPLNTLCIYIYLSLMEGLSQLSVIHLTSQLLILKAKYALGQVLGVLELPHISH